MCDTSSALFRSLAFFTSPIVHQYAIPSPHVILTAESPGLMNAWTCNLSFPSTADVLHERW